VNRPAAVATVALLVLLVWGLMYGGWRARARRQDDLPEPPPAPDGWADRASAQGVEATYVSTTRAGDPLDRVAAHGLGARSAARVLVDADGVLVARTGAPDVFAPALRRPARGVPGRQGRPGGRARGLGLVAG
jgi:hypothetical protein